MAMKRRVAVVGLGSIGRRHTRLLLEREDVTVELVEPRKEAVAAIQSEFGLMRSHPSFEAMLDTRPDVVWIATPTPLHADQTVAALDIGSHVFCEKPMSSTLADARRMKAAADRAPGILNIGFYLHFWHGAIRVKELIANGFLGNVMHAHARVGSYTTLVNSLSRYQAKYPGQLFLDYSHQPDLFYWLLDAIPVSVWVAGFQGGDFDLTAVPNVVDLVCEYDRTLLTTVHLNYMQLPERHEYEIVGDRGWVIVDVFTGCVRLGNRQDGKARVESFAQERDDIFRAEQRAFFETTDGKRQPETSGSDGLVSSAICEAALKSWQARERVPVEV
jgi:predicted dehydrogenase